ncbi:translation initiation factor IF-2-like [Schistocerca piceifrons]|uniref:translation initiation factor IF-2-like n=1 Tax=Schistocerca piceifrons TaxID=274613 RepID=UPI001F5E527A|nr:translation initiation factor IF-2-like [Schistocerca piceifrons]
MPTPGVGWLSGAEQLLLYVERTNRREQRSVGRARERRGPPGLRLLQRRSCLPRLGGEIKNGGGAQQQVEPPPEPPHGFRPPQRSGSSGCADVFARAVPVAAGARRSDQRLAVPAQPYPANPLAARPLPAAHRRLFGRRRPGPRGRQRTGAAPGWSAVGAAAAVAAAAAAAAARWMDAGIWQPVDALVISAGAAVQHPASPPCRPAAEIPAARRSPVRACLRVPRGPGGRVAWPGPVCLEEATGEGAAPPSARRASTVRGAGGGQSGQCRRISTGRAARRGHQVGLCNQQLPPASRAQEQPAGFESSQCRSGSNGGGEKRGT